MITPQIITVFALCAYAQKTIYSGTGFGTYYYDVEQLNACGTDFSAQNEGPVECSFSTTLSLDQINLDYVVAMNHSQLVGDMALYCGKKVIVSVNGVPSSLPLFIGDGCQRCGTGSVSSNVWNPNGAPGLDFSYSVLSELSASACNDGHISISWEIVDETLYDFDTNAPGSPEGPVAGTDPSLTSEDVVNTPSNSVSTGTPTVFSDQSTAASSTSNNSSGTCATGAWQCNGNVLEQCLNGSWTTRVSCAAGLTCQGGDVSYCVPPWA